LPVPSWLAQAVECHRESNFPDTGSLVGPVAQYSDPLLSRVLVASTYPLEIVQLLHWLENRGSFMNEKATKGEESNEI
jgi:hypothetical protein